MEKEKKKNDQSLKLVNETKKKRKKEIKEWGGRKTKKKKKFTYIYKIIEKNKKYTKNIK
ncbi:hypothetical protein [Acinetobacter baumannii]|uniref:hypothetical protein n=1 Tax=Acinetobacter baumannii TaxID=470 RepID=UPI0012AB8506|nr:hypothetical protein [Acinetobacter baumannii]